MIYEGIYSYITILTWKFNISNIIYYYAVQIRKGQFRIFEIDTKFKYNEVSYLKGFGHILETFN